MSKPVCLVLGAGAGIGGSVAKRFARDGYHACLARRTDQPGLDLRAHSDLAWWNPAGNPDLK